MSLAGAFIVPHPPLIIPGIGMGQEMKVKKTMDSYLAIARKIAEIRPDTIIVTTPHSCMYSDYIHISPGSDASGSFGEFGRDDISMDVEYDEDFVKRLSSLAGEMNISAGTLGEKNKRLDHGTMIPLYYINNYYSEYKAVRISISGLSFAEHYRFGKCIQKIAEEIDKKVIFIASGDLSHMLKDEGPYGYRVEGAVFDRELTAAISNGNFLKLLNLDEEFCEVAGECGMRSFIILAGALNGRDVDSRLLSYEGPFGVGYAVAEFTIKGHNEERNFDEIYLRVEEERVKGMKKEEDIYVRLARRALESYVIGYKRIKKSDDLDNELLDNRAGVFVSLQLDGSLRGCIGTIEPAYSCVADEIIQNAISAGMEDPRFYPVREDELPRMIYSVDVLGVPEPIESMDELDPLRYGVIVVKNSKRGLLLPNLESVNTPEEQVSIALKKAGISPSDNYSIERFEVIRHK